MIGVQSPSGKKGLILRGIMTPAGKKGIAQGSILTPDGDRVFWDGSLAALNVNITPSYVQGGVASPAFVTINTAPATCSASGGAAPYSYAWTLSNPDGPGWIILDANKQTAVFQAHHVGPNESRTAEVTCTVTDARGATGSATATAFVLNYGGL